VAGISPSSWGSRCAERGPRGPGDTVDLGSAGTGQLKRLRFPTVGDGKDLLVFAPFVPYFSVVDPLTLVAQFASLPLGPVAVDVRDDSNAMLACAHATPTQGFRLMMTTEADAEPDVDAAGNPIGLPAWQVATRIRSYQ
jgi:hypothetical protein